MTTKDLSSQDFSPPLNRMIISLLAMIGLSVALYMWAYAAGLTGPVICGIGNCEAVQNSEYAHMGNIPVAAFGVAGYLALLGVALLGLQPRFGHSRVVARLLVLGAFTGVLFSAYLTYLEAFVILAWCQWCVSSAIIMVLVFLSSTPELKRLGRCP